MSDTASTRIYYVIYLALMVLLGVTVGAAYVKMGVLQVPVAFLISVTKALLVIWFFMHIKQAPRIFALFIGMGVVTGVIGIILICCDYLSRL